MGRQKKNELDAILEQLKNSYAAKVDDELEDSLLETEESEEDAELASVLEKIFSSTASESREDNDVQTDEAEEPVYEEEPVAEAETVEEDSQSEQADESVSEPIIENSDAIDEADHELEKSDNSSEENRVDDVLNMMFHRDTTPTEPPAVDEQIEEEEVEIADIADEDNDNDDAPSIDDTEQNEYSDDNSDTEPPVTYVIPNEKIEDGGHDQLFEIGIENAIKEIEEANSLFEFAGFDDVNAEELDSCCDDDNTEDRYIDDLIAEYAEEQEQEEESGPPAKMVLDPADYTEDVLQHSLSDMVLFKPQDDLDYSMFDRKVEDEAKDDEAVEDILRPSVGTEISENDVSLLLKFGYSEEIASSVGQEYAQSVVVEKNNEYVPQKHHIVHGFTGKEFSSKAQVDKIGKKYKSDRMRLLIIGFITSFIAISMLVIDVIAAFSIGSSDYASLMSIELLLTVALILLLCRRLLIGALGIVRFEANPYSMLSVILAEYFIYCASICVMYLNSPVIVYSKVYAAFGGFVAIYAALAVWGEYLDCLRESNTFDIMSDGDQHCILEKSIGEERTSKHSTLRYSVKKTEFVSGFFRRMLERRTPGIKVVLVAGIMPFIAIVAGVGIAIMKDSAILGMNAAGYILFSAVPLSCVIVPAAIEYLHSIKLKKTHSAFIGVDSVNEYSFADSISFFDDDAVEITAVTEINPNKSHESSKKWINIASNVFEALGGPLAKTVHRGQIEESNVKHDLTICSISENGLDVYFDSAMNVLIGDRQYLAAHNIKVKTDTNLTAAVKGAERTVVYMAFDGIPQIAFIVTAKIKRSFLETIELLEKNAIKTNVISYEPEINEYYFEANKVSGALNVIKPSHYERRDISSIADSGIIAGTPKDLCSALIHGREIIADRKRARKTRIIQTATGLSVAGILVILSCIPGESVLLGFIQSVSLLIFYLVACIGLIPDVVRLIKLWRDK